jgi:hypothetical protein
MWSWKAEFDEYREGVPRALRLQTVDPQRTDVRISLHRVEPHAFVRREALTAEIPSSYRRLTWAEMQAIPPLGER